VPDQGRVYEEGVLAGQDASSAGLALPSVPAPDNAFGEIASLVGHAIEGGHTVSEVVKNAIAQDGVAVVKHVGAGIVFFFAWESILGPDRSEPYFDEAASQAFLRVRNELDANGLASDNVELFMAACDRKDHGNSDQDAMMKQGWWHGRLYLNFDQAQAEAQGHEHPDNTWVLRFQTVAPDTIEFIGLSPQ
jgi:hypothetical protein